MSDHVPCVNRVPFALIQSENEREYPASIKLLALTAFGIELKPFELNYPSAAYKERRCVFLYQVK